MISSKIPSKAIPGATIVPAPRTPRLPGSGGALCCSVIYIYVSKNKYIYIYTYVYIYMYTQAALALGVLVGRPHCSIYIHIYRVCCVFLPRGVPPGHASPHSSQQTQIEEHTYTRVCTSSNRLDSSVSQNRSPGSKCTSFRLKAGVCWVRKEKSTRPRLYLVIYIYI